ncbi:cell wall anchored protein [Diplodia corticola]|uniref:Cell wall anchored protein n=1 Tax=Diplodia corticola TaxID=236234 RepID=A0A1J9RBV3_9PEZI|nr:cell wall anchored protein [Diplodia corticola]OJD38040.1 cell wall anchored protein [Diplodia corticola]
MLRRTSIFIDGGVELYQDSHTRWLGANRYIYEFDMSRSWDSSTNFTESRIGRYSASSSASNPPNMVRGGLFAAMTVTNHLFTFGGTTFLANDSDPDWAPPSRDPTTLWSFDTELRNWQSVDVSAAVPWRPNWGAQAEDVAHSVGFFLNGIFDRGSSYGLYSSVEYTGGQVTNATFDQISYLGGLVMIDLQTRETRNLSTADLGQPRVAGGLVHAPGFGKTENGTLVAFGGMRSSGNGGDDGDTFTNGDLIDFSTVSLCDSFWDENVTWVNQTTTGDIPPPRMDFCTCPGQKSPSDNSSYNFYIHGGIDPSTGKIYDDVHVLSFPSFTWTLVSNGSSTNTSSPGYFGHTCNSAGKYQMLATGGARDASLLGVETTGDIPDLSQTTCDDGGIGNGGAGVRLFDMNEGTWGTFYDADQAKNFLVPTAVVKKIGGSPTGAATMTTPAHGFDSPAIYTMFHPPPPSATSSSSPSTHHSSASTLSPGAIAGIVVGSLAGSSLLAGLALWFFCCRASQRRQRRRHRRGDLQPTRDNMPADAAGAAHHLDEKSRQPMLQEQQQQQQQGQMRPPLSELPSHTAEVFEKPADESGWAGDPAATGGWGWQGGGDKKMAGAAGAADASSSPPPPQELDAVEPARRLELDAVGAEGEGEGEGEVEARRRRELDAVREEWRRRQEEERGEEGEGDREEGGGGLSPVEEAGRPGMRREFSNDSGGGRGGGGDDGGAHSSVGVSPIGSVERRRGRGSGDYSDSASQRRQPGETVQVGRKSAFAEDTR